VLASDKLLLVAIDDSFSMNAAAGGALPAPGWMRRSAGAVVLAARRRTEGAGDRARGQMRLLTSRGGADELRGGAEYWAGDGHGDFAAGRGMRAMAETCIRLWSCICSAICRIEHAGNFADMVMPETSRWCCIPWHGKCELATGRGERAAPGQLVDTKKAGDCGDCRHGRLGDADGLAGGEWRGEGEKSGCSGGWRATVVFEGGCAYGESRCGAD